MAQKITFQERLKIAELLNKDYPIKLIAKMLNRHPSSIYREILRSPGSYAPTEAQNDALLKARNSRKKEILQNKTLRNYTHNF